MSAKNETEVLIGGKTYTLSGYESEEYLQSLASYINMKTDHLKQQGGFPKLDADISNILIQINIADDYFKAKKQIEILEDELKRKEKELYDLKHELISAQIKMESMEKAHK